MTLLVAAALFAALALIGLASILWPQHTQDHQ